MVPYIHQISTPKVHILLRFALQQAISKYEAVRFSGLRLEFAQIFISFLLRPPFLKYKVVKIGNAPNAPEWP